MIDTCRRRNPSDVWPGPIAQSAHVVPCQYGDSSSPRQSHGMGVLWLRRDGAWSMRWKPWSWATDRRQRDRPSGHRRQLRRRGVARAVQYGRRVVVRDLSLVVLTVLIFLLFPTVISDDYRLARDVTDSTSTLVRKSAIYRADFRLKRERNSCSHLIREFVSINT